LASCNFGNFQLNSSKILTFNKNTEITLNFGNLQFWQLAILEIFNSIHQKYKLLTKSTEITFNFANFAILAQLAILATCNFANFQLNSSKIQTFNKKY
jgi:hypothetical protein